jgi:nicotinic acid phosphoribosyltransferase
MGSKSALLPEFYIDTLPAVSTTRRIGRLRFIEIDASTSHVFTWISQLRVAPYSYDYIDNHGRRSPYIVVKNLPALKNGAHCLLAFHVYEFEEDSFLVCRFCEPVNSPLNLFIKGLYIEYRLVETANKTHLWCKILGFVNRGIVSKTAFLMICGINRFMMRRQLRVIKKLSEKLAAGKIKAEEYPLERSYIKSGLHWWIFCRRRHCPSLITNQS